MVVDASYGGGYATGGFVCRVVQGCPSSYPANSRIVVVGGEALVGFAGSPALRTAAHEIGHAIFWPHSYSPAWRRSRTASSTNTTIRWT